MKLMKLHVLIFRNMSVKAAQYFLVLNNLMLLSKLPKLSNRFLCGFQTCLNRCCSRYCSFLCKLKSVCSKLMVGFLSEANYDTFIGKLLTFKMIVNELGKETTERGDLDDATTDLDFYVDKVLTNPIGTR